MSHTPEQIERALSKHPSDEEVEIQHLRKALRDVADYSKDAETMLLAMPATQTLSQTMALSHVRCIWDIAAKAVQGEAA